ncbi:MAG: penicillin-binding transpeptidase domain-containing protein [Planctomycetota bacterium]
MAFAAVCLVMGAQQVKLGVVEGDERLERAQAKLYRQTWVPTIRGRILDRKGRVMAMDRPSYSVEVDYAVLTGAWAGDQAERFARRAHSDRWGELTIEQRERLIAAYQPFYDRHIERMWARLARRAGRDQSAVESRVRATVRRVESMHARLVERRTEAEIADRVSRGLALGDEDRAAIAARARAPIAEQRSPHVIIADLRDRDAFGLLAMTEQRVPLLSIAGDAVARTRALDETVPLLPGVTVRHSTDRVHPFETVVVAIDKTSLPGPLKGDGAESVTLRGVAGQVVGAVRKRLYAEDTQRRAEAIETDESLRERSLTERGTDRGAYRSGDAVGRRGLERAHEHTLRGLRGVRTRRLDTGEMRQIEPDTGRDVRLTLDVMLQARVRAALEPAVGLTRVQPWHKEEGVPLGQPLAGAAVVLDIDTGDILAMVSTPAVTHEGDPADDLHAELAEFHPASVNRAIAAPYPPGSISKALILPEAVSRGHHRLGDGIECTGHLLPGRPGIFRCWIYKRFGSTHSPGGEPVTAEDALKVSCNIYFYELGRRMGAEKVAESLADFGLGQAFGLGLGPEWPGQIGRTAGADATGLVTQDAILMAIGQGPVTWTPLHAASAYATLVRAGVHVRPRLVDNGSFPEVSEVELDRSSVVAAIEGLRLAANDPRGTGATIDTGRRREATFNSPHVTVWGKTGTAQAPALVHDADGDGPEEARVVRTGDHAWYVAVVGPEGGQPSHAIAVIVEYGGSGGKVAGPVANQIVRALAAEGYLGEPAFEAVAPAVAATVVNVTPGAVQ